MAIDERQDGPEQDVVIEGHNYDGIREYDNPMPGWWLGIFWASVVFAPIYMLGVHVFGFIDTYEEDLAQGQAELQEIRSAHEAANPTFLADEGTLAAYVGDEVHVEAGARLFATNCAACHGNAGQGLIGPNLTDRYWIHGSRNADLFGVITNGVIEKGMTPWGSILSPEQRAQLVAFIRSIEGTEPDGAREPQGELFEEGA
jgi:cytochrome c oxidase cbb3-type subunit 3